MPDQQPEDDPRHDHLDQIALRSGILLAVALGLLYLVIADRAGRPLGILSLAPLLAAAIGGPRPTFAVGGVAIVLATVEGYFDDALGAESVIVNVTLVALTTALATRFAASRRREAVELVDVSSTNLLLDAFQRRLVPRPTPPPDVLVASRYVPGEGRLRLGGDFVDLIRVSEHHSAFIVGDVSGHGPDAAAFGAAVRAGWKSLAVALPARPVEWLTTLEQAFFTDGRFDGFVTALTGWIEPANRSITLASAGHCWPIVITGRSAEIVELEPGVPLGVTPTAQWTTRTITLGPGEFLVLYTDGLIENRRNGQGTGCGDTGLAAWLADNRTDGVPDLDRLLDDLGPAGFDDDVAIVCISFAGTQTSIRSSAAAPAAPRPGSDPTPTAPPDGG